ncbi:hypothetical protein NVP1139A_06 [Vibrio phage 1.139.A._10N.261.48.C6]|nr:hypothetical protein NVP1034O_06 [Vibrio phage 1.034.O._10N.261.46.B7]AUR83436.1 hypothetical protein NVP1034X_06 [Vibrio phage 1.034.X._10N.261.46.B7]AUR90174.1 hypothetical protein NVP1139A_06 [Vibrio phage 1.139.A._10N.261.48.C6]AUR90241.1 hypothetical protein NVP1139B_06 [Vibrio phage 1.139.B._10N.261.48.C6]
MKKTTRTLQLVAGRDCNPLRLNINEAYICTIRTQPGRPPFHFEVHISKDGGETYEQIEGLPIGNGDFSFDVKDATHFTMKAEKTSKNLQRLVALVAKEEGDE